MIFSAHCAAGQLKISQIHNVAYVTTGYNMSMHAEKSHPWAIPFSCKYADPLGQQKKYAGPADLVKIC